MQDLTPEGLKTVQYLAQTHAMSPEAVTVLLRALVAGNGAQAQFSHPELGGMGQWSQGGMIMIGDMFNNNLKATVNSLAETLSGMLRDRQLVQPDNTTMSGSFFSSAGVGSSPWPADLGAPASSGAQNDMQYAFFPNKRRLAIRHGDRTCIFDTGDHNIFGFGQQQGGDQTLTFTSQNGLIRIADLPKISTQQDGGPAQPVAQAPTTSFTASAFTASAPAPSMSVAPQAIEPAIRESIHPAAPASPSAAAPQHDILLMLEKLAALRDKKILSDAEFAAKKTELLARL